MVLETGRYCYSPEGQSPRLTPKSLKHGTLGIFTSRAGGVGTTPSGGGPGTTPQRITGVCSPGGSIIGTTVTLEDPGDVVVIH